MRLSLSVRLRNTQRQAWNIAFPVIIGGLSQNVITLVDTYFLGRYVGEVALGAGGLAGIWYFTLIVFAMGLGSGLQVLVARHDGEGNPHAIGRVTDAALQIGLILSVAVAIFHQLFSPAVMRAFCKSEAVAEAASEFLFWRSFDVPLTALFFLLRGYLNGIQRNQFLIKNAVITTVINTVGCYLLVYVAGWGIKGAAIATVIAEFFAAGTLVWYIVHKRMDTEHRFFRFKWAPRPDYKELVSLSLPTALQYVLSMASFFVFINIIEKMGERPLAASELIKNIYIFFMIPTWGFGTATGSMVSNLIGQKKMNAILPSLWGIIRFSFLVTFVTSAALALIPGLILSAFTKEPGLVEVSVPIMPIIFFSLLVYSVSGVLLNAVIGAGATKYALGIEITMLSVYLTYLFGIHYGSEPTLLRYWYSEFIYMGILGGGSASYFLSRYWKKLRLSIQQSVHSPAETVKS